MMDERDKPGQCASGLGEIVQVREGVGGKASWSLHILLSLSHSVVLIVVVLSKLHLRRRRLLLLLLKVLLVRDSMVSYIRMSISRRHGNKGKVWMSSSIVHISAISRTWVVSSERVERPILHRHDSVI